MTVWPFPGDSPVVKARKVALAYRSVAEELHKALLAHQAEAADPVADLDQRFRKWGITWHAEATIVHSDDDWVSAKEAANLVHLSKGAISRLRATGRLKGEWRGYHDGYYFRVGDVYALSNEVRSRKLGSIDSINTNGGTAPS